VRAIVLREFGPPEALRAEEVPDPEGEAVIDVEVASVTFVETQIRAGRPPNPAMAPQLPVIPGNGVGGLLDGRPVISATGGSGGYAERVAVAPGAPIPVPEELSLADAVALLADGRTAMGLVRAADIQHGETVLVEAAAGGVGSLLVQLARNAGARVIAAAGGARKLRLACELGADLAVDYTEPAWIEAVGPVDVAFDGVGGAIGTAAFALVREGGRFMPFGMASGSFAQTEPRDRVTVVRRSPPDPAELRELTQAALAQTAAGRLQPVIGQTFPLEDASAAHAAIESRSTVGKTLLLVR
jgi:NADPH2:quinone reductase